MMAESRSYLPMVLLAAVVFAADQASKHFVETLTVAGSTREVIPGLVNLVHTSNPGVAFGLLADSEMPWRAPLLIFFSVAVIGLIVWLVATGRAGGWLGQYGMTLI